MYPKQEVVVHNSLCSDTNDNAAVHVSIVHWHSIAGAVQYNVSGVPDFA